MSYKHQVEGSIPSTPIKLICPVGVMEARLCSKQVDEVRFLGGVFGRPKLQTIRDPMDRRFAFEASCEGSIPSL